MYFRLLSCFVAVFILGSSISAFADELSRQEAEQICKNYSPDSELLLWTLAPSDASMKGNPDDVFTICYPIEFGYRLAQSNFIILKSKKSDPKGILKVYQVQEDRLKNFNIGHVVTKNSKTEPDQIMFILEAEDREKARNCKTGDTFIVKVKIIYKDEKDSPTHSVGKFEAFFDESYRNL